MDGTRAIRGVGTRRAVRWLFAVLVALGAPGLPGSGARAAGGTYYVGSTDGVASVTTGCTTDGNTTCTLRGALEQNATDGGGGTVRFSGTFPGGPTTITSGGGGQVVLANAVTIDGTGKRVTISGNNAVIVFVVQAGVTATLRALTVTGGNTIGGACSSGNGASAGGYGGGLCNFGTTTVERSTFAGNTAGIGGGIANFSTLALVNSTLTGNTATFLEGGGLFNGILGNGPGVTTVTNSTVVGNGANGSGAGGLRRGNGTLTLRNSIVAGNTGGGGNCSGTITDGGNNLSYGVGAADTTCPATFTRTADPLLAPLGDYGGPTQTRPPFPGSPAIDAGNTSVCAAAPVNNLDQRELPRPVGAACDIGAVESQGFVLNATSGTSQGATVGGAFPAPLAVTVREVGGTGLLGQGVVVTFGVIPAGNGAGVALSTDNATTDATGRASVTATANGTVGSYSVVATGARASGGALFVLTNTPLVSAVGPSSGDVRGGGLVAITGAGFTPGQTSVTIGGAAATVEDATATGITVRAPAHAVGTVDVTVTVNGIGTTKAGAYTYGAVNAAPTPTRPAGTSVGTPPAPPPARTSLPTPGATTPTPLPVPVRRIG